MILIGKEKKEIKACAFLTSSFIDSLLSNDSNSEQQNTNTNLPTMKPESTIFFDEFMLHWKLVKNLCEAKKKHKESKLGY